MAWPQVARVLPSPRGQDPRIPTGLIAGLLGYPLILTPTLIATAPSDVSVPESISTAALGAALITPAILLGTAVGAGCSDYPKTHLYRRPR